MVFALAMDENSASAAFFAGFVIPVGFDHDIIKPIIAPHLLVTMRKGSFDPSVIGAVRDGITPSLLFSDHLPRKKPWAAQTMAIRPHIKPDRA